MLQNQKQQINIYKHEYPLCKRDMKKICVFTFEFTQTAVFQLFETYKRFWRPYSFKKFNFSLFFIHKHARKHTTRISFLNQRATDHDRQARQPNTTTQATQRITSAAISLFELKLMPNLWLEGWLVEWVNEWMSEQASDCAWGCHVVNCQCRKKKLKHLCTYRKHKMVFVKILLMVEKNKLFWMLRNNFSRYVCCKYLLSSFCWFNSAPIAAYKLSSSGLIALGESRASSCANKNMRRALL